MPSRVLPDIHDGWNRNGVDSENGQQTKACCVLQDCCVQKGRRAELLFSPGLGDDLHLFGQ
jgi:hypothetical protein